MKGSLNARTITSIKSKYHGNLRYSAFSRTKFNFQIDFRNELNEQRVTIEEKYILRMQQMEKLLTMEHSEKISELEHNHQEEIDQLRQRIVDEKTKKSSLLKKPSYKPRRLRL
jgi:hypothetical protein